MKKFVNAELEEVLVKETAYGPNEPNKVDAEKYAVIDEETGKILGYKAKFGSPNEES